MESILVQDHVRYVGWNSSNERFGSLPVAGRAVEQQIQAREYYGKSCMLRDEL